MFRDGDGTCIKITETSRMGYLHHPHVVTYHPYILKLCVYLTM